MKTLVSHFTNPECNFTAKLKSAVAEVLFNVTFVDKEIPSKYSCRAMISCVLEASHTEFIYIIHVLVPKHMIWN